MWGNDWHSKGQLNPDKFVAQLKLFYGFLTINMVRGGIKKAGWAVVRSRRCYYGFVGLFLMNL
ncbi:hypothetical protein JCM18694_18160 [Prolixibacter denitrificans]|uniref:Uncharacterized protein n=1 Tax=Prolixibacter denitrificans TaxID=1541063 RepID=A0ABQ0ZK07_9BACT|nr:hypothetical protein JCM18694_18160 [Prolixibacter denitrificans]